MDHSFDEDGDVRMVDAPAASPSVEMDFSSPSFTSTPVRQFKDLANKKRSFDVMAVGSDVQEQEEAPQPKARAAAPFERRWQRGEETGPRSQHDNRPCEQSGWPAVVPPSELACSRRAPAEERAPILLGRVSYAGHVLRSIGWSLYCTVTGTKRQQETQQVALSVGNNQRRCIDGGDKLEMPGAWPASPAPSLMVRQPPARRAAREHGSVRWGGRRGERSWRVEKAVQRAQRRKEVQSGWWIRLQRESGASRVTERAVVGGLALSPIREVSSPAQSEARESLQQSVDPVARHHAQAHAVSVLHEPARAPRSPAPLATPASQAAVRAEHIVAEPAAEPALPTPSPAAQVSSPIVAEDEQRYIHNWSKQAPPGPRRSMRSMTKAEREEEKDRRVDELIAKSKLLALDTPEVAAARKVVKETIRVRQQRELEHNIQLAREAEEERQLEEEHRNYLRLIDQRKLRLREQQQAEQAAERAKQLAEQRAKDAALAQEIRETEERLEAQKKAHEGIARRTRSSHGFKLAGALNDEWAAKMTDISAGGRDDDKIATTDTGTELNRITFQRILANGRRGQTAWLDDDAVNAFILSAVNAKNEAAGWDKKTSQNAPLYACINSNWYPQWRNKGAPGLKNWARRQRIDGQKLLDAKNIFLPINTGAHWTLIVIKPQDRKIQYLDSLDGSGTRETQAAREWLQLELGSRYKPEDWSAERGLSQQQNNSDDCGVFTAYNALATMLDLPYKEVTAAKMPHARRQMAAVLLNGGFTGVFKI